MFPIENCVLLNPYLISYIYHYTYVKYVSPKTYIPSLSSVLLKDGRDVDEDKMLNFAVMVVRRGENWLDTTFVIALVYDFVI